MRFRFVNCPLGQTIVGIMQRSLVDSNYIYEAPSKNSCKKFVQQKCFQGSQGCSKLLKGLDLNHNLFQDICIEMRIDFDNNYIDFYDYPEIKNINAFTHQNTFSEGEYVIAFALFCFQSIVIESLQELSALEELGLNE